MSLKSLAVKAFNIFGGSKLLRVTNRTPMILFWHGVCDNPSAVIEAECISTSDFRRQIEYLMRYYEIISIEEFNRRYLSNSFTNKEVVLTFDDGYKNNLTVAAKILKGYNLPYTIFLSTSNISSGERFYASIPRFVLVGGDIRDAEIKSLPYKYAANSLSEVIHHAFEIENRLKKLTIEKALEVADEIRSLISNTLYTSLCSKYTGGGVLTWDEVRELCEDENCTLGSHCCEHICCHSCQSKERIVEEITRSKHIIESETSRKCDFFSYPNGDFTAFSNSIVKENYLMGFSTDSHRIVGGQENTACVGRVSCPKDFDKFKILIGFKSNAMAKRLLRLPHSFKKKIVNYCKWFLFRISQLGCLNPISPRLRPWLWKKIGVNINGSVCIGYDVYFDVGNAHLITIEDGVWITSRCLLLCHKRDMTDYKKGDDYNMLPYKKEPIHLKKGCCIGMGSTIMPGVTVGNGSVIGAGSLVTKSIPDWCIATGRPAKVVKQL